MADPVEELTDVVDGEIMDRLNGAKDALVRLKPTEHASLNMEVTQLYTDLVTNKYVAGPEQKAKAAQLAGLVITHILHVQGDDKYLKDYYKEFITSKSPEFEARWTYTTAILDLMDNMGLLQKDPANSKARSPKGLWDQAKKTVERARGMLKGLKESAERNDGVQEVTWDHRYLRASFDAMEKLRIAVVNIYHKLDSPNGYRDSGSAKE
jgi:hypothetical protein